MFSTTMICLDSFFVILDWCHGETDQVCGCYLAKRRVYCDTMSQWLEKIRTEQRVYYACMHCVRLHGSCRELYACAKWQEPSLDCHTVSGPDRCLRTKYRAGQAFVSEITIPFREICNMTMSNWIWDSSWVSRRKV